MRQLLIFILTIIVSAPSFAGCKDSTCDFYPKSPGEITIRFKDAPVSEVVDYINSECKDYMETIATQRPVALISLNFEAIECNSAAVIIKDFDSTEEKT